jgi:hypothetical protein
MMMQFANARKHRGAFCGFLCKMHLDAERACGKTGLEINTIGSCSRASGDRSEAHRFLFSTSDENSGRHAGYPAG